MKTASAAKMAAQFNDYLDASREQPVLITRNGKPVAVLLAVQDKAEAERLVEGRPRTLRSVFEEAHEQIEKGGGIPHVQFWREVERSRADKSQGINNRSPFSQQDYDQLLDAQNARARALTQGECERILMDAGATYEQAKNGDFVYLHHGDTVSGVRTGSKEEYERLLNEFGALSKTPKACINYLESLGFGYRQAQTAVHKYRQRHDLIGK